MKQTVIISFALIFSYGITQAQENGRIPAKGFAVFSADDTFHPCEFTRHAIGDNDILIETMYAGICHSDLHAARDEHKSHGVSGIYPMIPGHEIAGRVVKVGKNVTRFKVGDYAGVGCMVNSCGHCTFCAMDKEQFCENGTTFTYNSIDRYHDNEPAMGGYSDNMVVNEKFAIRIPKTADMKRVAPLLCAGVTIWSPIHFSKVGKGDKVGVAGFGGLGHMAVQYLVHLGADVTVFDITEEKRADAARMGASRYANVNNESEMKGLNNVFDFIISTIPSQYSPLMYTRMLKYGKGEMAVVGLPETATINATDLALGGAANRKVYGSLIGGIKETQEMLDYFVAHDIYPEVEVIPANAAEIDKAYRNVQDGKVKFRYVIDMDASK
ncbi:MAG: NAD(P)-dependent alcohol dehydrogenase [Akkermansiaceae bacterium]|nr:NAD(P)-dependent alcohol dehydrogenase [Akkermansiaceae bacterium]